MPTKPKAKLWGKIEEIMSTKTSKFGAQKYQIKLVDVAKLIWVFTKNLSTGVVESHNNGKTIPKNAKARVDRGYVDKQKTFFSQV